MPRRIEILNGSAIGRIKSKFRQVRQETRAPRNAGRGERTTRDARSHYIALAPEGGIPARSGTTLGTADCNIYSVDKTAALLQLVGPQTVYNLSETEIAAGEYVIAHRDGRGLLIVEGVAAGGGGADPVAVLFQAPEGGIEARAGEVPGEGSGDLLEINGDGDLELTGDGVTVLNFVSQAVCVNGDRLGVAVKWGDAWLIVADDCVDESSTTFPEA